MRRERGVAAITAVLIVAVAASAAALMLAQQSAMLDQTSLVAARAQADLFARAGIDWSRGILLEDMALSATYDGLDEGWAQPLAGMPVERAVVSGAIADEQGKFNLNNLVQNNGHSDADVKVFQRLLVSLNLSPDLADAVLDWIDADNSVTGSGGAEDAYYLSLAKPYRTANAPMMQVEELYRIRGFDAPTVAKLRPYVTALGEHTAINLNTASDIVLMALMPDVPKDKIENAIAMRKTRPFKTPQMVTDWDAHAANYVPASLDIKSAYFSTVVAVSQDDVQLATDALLVRAQGQVNVVWQRPRF
ncbi:MAG TPA: type II secretion system minor pseudopilin GspK [Usitatibacter sp.]|nr:type II secretion system minor pseudopilin GspK [Usitatibacter sp.]